MLNNNVLSIGSHIFYPAHGIGLIESIETQTIAGTQTEFLVIAFDKEKMKVKVPISKAEALKIRPLCNQKTLDLVFKALSLKPKHNRINWSRRNNEYYEKIQSGDPIMIAEVIRDLYGKVVEHTQFKQSSGEKAIYSDAMERLSAEVAILKQVDKATAQWMLEKAIHCED